MQDFWDRGLLGLAIASDGRVFIAYSHDTGWGDSCPDGGTAPPGCKIDGRLSRIDASGVEHVLITDFCQQFPSHSVGTLAFGPDGMLYLSAGEGAHFDYADFGQIGNVCEDPPNPGGDIGPPDSQGGALRAQAFRRPLAQPFTPDGTILRIDPDRPRIDRSDDRGVWLPQPVPVHVPAGHERDLDGRRRLDDVGGAQPRAARRDRAQLRLALLRGRRHAARLDALNVTTCESLYAEGSATPPYFTYNHAANVVAGDGCAPGDSSISAVSFSTGPVPGQVPRRAVLRRLCAQLHLVHAARGRRPARPGAAPLFAGDAPGPVFLTEGPGGVLYYADFNDGEIRRIAYSAPSASIAASPDGLEPPLTMHFDGRGSRDPEGGASPTPGTSTATAPTTTRPRRRPRGPTRSAAS